MLVNGDVWCDLDYRTIPKKLAKKDQALIYLVKQPSWRDRGDFSLLNNRVIESENPEYLYAGIALYHPSILNGARVEKFSIVPRLKKAISQNRVSGILYNGEWDDVGTPERLEAIQENYGK
jgi:MurNAc alpha-1-phosphate uridylyltransferase